MPRTARIAPGGLVHHVLNRSAGKRRLFDKDADFEAFERVVIEAQQRQPIRLLGYCVLPNRWHFVVWPRQDGELSAFFRWMAHTHAMRWRRAHRRAVPGHLYQGRFKCFPVQRGEHLLNMLQYIERSPLEAGLVTKAEDWPWSSLWARLYGDDAIQSVLSPWPVKRPEDWTDRVNAPLSEHEQARARVSIERGRPYGSEAWISRTVSELKMEHTVRPRGRPPKQNDTAARR